MKSRDGKDKTVSNIRLPKTGVNLKNVILTIPAANQVSSQSRTLMMTQSEAIKLATNLLVSAQKAKNKQ